MRRTGRKWRTVWERDLSNTDLEDQLLSDCQRPDEEVVLLHVGGAAGEGVGVHAVAVDEEVADDAQLVVVAVREHVEQRRLARARRPHDGQQLAGTTDARHCRRGGRRRVRGTAEEEKRREVSLKERRRRARVSAGEEQGKRHCWRGEGWKRLYERIKRRLGGTAGEGKAVLQRRRE